MKQCETCGREFAPAKPYYFICPACWQANYQTGEHCHAINDNGYACRAWAVQGGYFCRAHIQHYGLFTLAVERLAQSARRWAEDYGAAWPEDLGHEHLSTTL